jgi:hypothetical protein
MRKNVRLRKKTNVYEEKCSPIEKMRPPTRKNDCLWKKDSAYEKKSITLKKNLRL